MPQDAVLAGLREGGADQTADECVGRTGREAEPPRQQVPGDRAKEAG